RVMRRDLLELLEILAAHLGVIVDPLQMGLIPAPNQAELSLPLDRAIAEASEQLAQRRPVVARCSRRGEPGHGAHVESVLLEVLAHPLGHGRTYPRQEL